MYKGFNLKLNNGSDFNNFLIDNYKEYGKEICKEKRTNTIESLDKYIGKDGQLNCSALKDDWFPKIESNIFISHSHDDEDLAASLAGWFHKEFKLESFIDSYVWGYCNDLLREIDDKYCRHSNGVSYDYDKRNYSTSHVHMMLSTALNQMIDKSECVIFLNTDKSVLTAKDTIGCKTRSPWIYSEINETRTIQKTVPKRLENKPIFKKSLNESKQIFDSAEMKPEYDLDLTHLVKLNENQLMKLNQKYNIEYPNEATDALDDIYRITHII